MSRSRSKLLIVSLAAASALVAWLAFSGCSAEVSVGGGGSEASGEEIAEKVRGDYADKTGIALDHLTCEGVKVEVGARFECSGSNAHGVQLEITGKVTDTSSDSFDYRWHVSKAVAPGVLYERALRREIEERGVTLSEVRCPVQIEVEVGAEVHCEAADASGEVRDVTLTLTDLDGGFDFTVAGGPSESTGPTESSTS